MSRKPFIPVSLLCLVFCFGWLGGGAVLAQDGQVADSLAKIAGYEYGQSRVVMTGLQEYTLGLYSQPGKLKEIEKQYCAFLQSDASLAAKDFVFRQLSQFGSEECVPVVSSFLADPQMSDMARFALERIESPAVDEALREALDTTVGLQKVGVINTIGQRKDAGAVPMLGVLTGDADEGVALAAASSLGKIGSDGAYLVLAGMADKTQGAVREAVLDAQLSCADAWVRQGRVIHALKIYQKLFDSEKQERIRVAALCGLVQAQGEKAEPLLIEIIQTGSSSLKAAAISQANQVPGEEMTAKLSDLLAELEPIHQEQLVLVLAQRGDAMAVASITELIRSSDNEQVRKAGMQSLIGFEDVFSSVDLLGYMAASSSGEQQQVARESLYRLRGSNMDQAIEKKISYYSKESGIRQELVRAVGQRAIANAQDTLFDIAKNDSEPKVRVEAIRSLEQLAGADDAQGLIDLLVQSKSSAEQKAAEKSLATVLQKDRDSSLVLSALSSCEDKKVRLGLLGVLGKIGDAKSLPILRACLKDADPEIRKQGIRAMGEWPIADAAVDLIQVVQSSSDEGEKVLALRGYIQLIGLESDRSAKETVGMYAIAMDLAGSLAEKKRVLSGLGDVKGVESLDMVMKYLGDPQLQNEAEAAVLNIVEGIQKKAPQPCREALEMLVKTTQNDSVRKQAKELLANL